CTEYESVKWDVTKTVHDPCPAGWRVPQAADLQVLVDYNTSIPTTAKSDGGMLLKYDATNNRTYLRFTGYPPNITQLNYVGTYGYINSMGHNGTMAVSARSNKISV